MKKKITKISNGVAKKLIVILGPTASGKSKLAVKLALRLSSGQAKKEYKINGVEVVSADSRQIYQGMDIGTGKITKKEMQGIPHYLLDVASPKRRFTVVQYRKLARKAINKILIKKKVPILCGGTGFYIQAIIDGIIIPEVKPDYMLRSSLDKLEIEDLFKKLKKLDSKRARTIDKKNKRRLIRALEIVIKTKRPVPSLKKEPFPYPVLMIGVKVGAENKIAERINKMFKRGLEKEVRKLVEKYGWVTALQTIGYQEWKEYFERKISKNEVKNLIILHAKQYAKRQITWFKRDKRINWIKKQQEAEKLTKEFLEN